MGIYCYENLKQFDGQAGFYYSQETVTRMQLKNFWKNASEDSKREIQGLVLFRTETGIEIKNQELNQGETGDLIEAAGNMHLVIPGKLMKGSFVTDSDSHGCVISRKTAENIFGDRDIIGEKVLIGKKNYVIRGIVDMDKSLCMIQGDNEKSYSYIRVDAPRMPMSVVQQMLAGLLAEDCEWISEGNLYYGIGNIFLWLPVWAALFAGVFRYGKAVPRMGNEVFNYILKIMIPISGFAAGCTLLLVSFKFSDDYIPTVWSDFEFWTELVQQKKEMISMLLESPVQIADALMFRSLVGVMVVSALLVCGILWRLQIGLNKRFLENIRC